MLTAKETATGLEGTLQVALSRLPKDVQSDGLGIVQGLHAHKRLDEQRLGVPSKCSSG